MLWYSIPYHAIKWIYEWSNRTRIPCPQTWYVISHSSLTKTYYSFKDNYIQKRYPTSIFLQGRQCRDKETQYHPKLLHIYCDADHERYLSDRGSITSTTHLFNDTIIDQCSNSQYETSISSSKSEKRSMYTGVLYQNWIRNFCRAIGYPIGNLSKLYDENKVTIKRLFADRIKPQYRPLGVLITDIHNHHIWKTFGMVDTRSKNHHSDLK